MARVRSAAQGETGAVPPGPRGAPRVDALAVASFLAGPVAFAVDLAVSYFLVPRVHSGGSKLPLHVVTALAVAVLLAGAWAGRRVLRDPAWRVASGDGARAAERSRFLATGGLIQCAFFLDAVVAELIPKLLLAPRD